MKWLAEIESAIDRERPARRALRRGKSNAPKASRRGRGDPGRARLPEGLWQVDVAAQQLGVARPAYQKMLAAVMAGAFEVLLVDSLEQERAIRALERQRVRIVTASDGYASTSKARKIHYGFRGMRNELFSRRPARQDAPWAGGRGAARDVRRWARVRLQQRARRGRAGQDQGVPGDALRGARTVGAVDLRVVRSVKVFAVDRRRVEKVERAFARRTLTAQGAPH